MDNNTQNIHSAADKGFSRSGQLYESGRASYPPEAVEELFEAVHLEKKSKVLEIAAGTGKFTKQIFPFIDNIIAIEPVAEMRKKFSEQLPQVKILEGTAEKIPFESASFDHVFVATAYHWFDSQKALEEIHRVLQPQGYLGLIWNTWRKDVVPPWLKEIRDIVEPLGAKAPRYKSMQWKKPFDETKLFTPMQSKNFDYPVKLSADGVCQRFLSVSFISALPQEQFKQVEQKIREILARHLSLDGLFEMPYHNDIYWCQKI